ncbi:HNH endonuclease [Arthrobacter phage Elezi]|uniref:Uncharacterized protein n=1 Tax=Arthrobacter phage Elezi TaxID=2762410 RepID=A0A7G8LH44_9CAUD|nr:HNH endonuclease [Arthrobacter phage Elezi]QNJ56566.1 hypothetical protein SEA_ELEZI_66 [Arthrobacter phage Elezi]
MTCCKECAYPGNPGVCVEGGSCPCHDTEDNPLARLSAAALERRAYRLRHSGKECDRCRETKRLSAFSKDSREPDGLMRYCRACRAAAYRAGLV